MTVSDPQVCKLAPHLGYDSFSPARFANCPLNYVNLIEGVIGNLAGEKLSSSTRRPPKLAAYMIR